MERRTVFYAQLPGLGWGCIGLPILLGSGLVGVLLHHWVAPLYVALAGGLVALCALVANVLLPRGLGFLPPLGAIGVDGIQLGREFHSWAEVESVEQGSASTGEETYDHVRLKIRGKPEAEVFHPHRARHFVREVGRRMNAAEHPAKNRIGQEYRRAPGQSRAALTRVAIDGAAPLEERQKALAKLDAESAEEVVNATADRRLLDARLSRR